MPVVERSSRRKGGTGVGAGAADVQPPDPLTDGEYEGYAAHDAILLNWRTPGHVMDGISICAVGVSKRRMKISKGTDVHTRSGPLAFVQNGPHKDGPPAAVLAVCT